MTDQYGNYLCKSIFKITSSEQREFIFKIISNDAYTICSNCYGTHAFQVLIHMISSSNEKLLLANIFKDIVYPLSFDPYGNYVIIQIIEVIEESKRKYINSVILQNYISLANDQYGLCIVKMIITKCKNDALKSELISLLFKSLSNIISEKYGNYLVEHYIDEWKDDCLTDIISAISTNIKLYGLKIYSSRIIEKILTIESDNDDRSRLIESIFNNENIMILLRKKQSHGILIKAFQYASQEKKYDILKHIDIIVQNCNSEKQEFLIQDLLVHLNKFKKV